MSDVSPPSADSSRVIAVGDVHGCATALRTLLDEIQITAADSLIVLGDVIDRGPDSRGVLELLFELRSQCRLECILGNHEQMLLDTLDNRIALQEWLSFGGAETLDSYGKDAHLRSIDAQHVEFIRSWIDVIETPSHFFAHGNYAANKPLSAQPWAELRWQSLQWHAPPPHLSGKTAVLGHTSQKNGRILNLGHILCIDTYCCGGQWLSAVDVVAGEAWQANEQGDLRRGVIPMARRR